MKLYDSLTTKLIEFDTKKVSIYNCGPTVYNHVHIGNARPLVIFDVLYRYLKFKKSDVKYVLNITDIDDKIINKAIEQNKTESEISEYYYESYLKIKKDLNTLEMINPKVSDNIQEIIHYIDKLVKNGFAYIHDNNVYFDTTKIKEYGELSKNKIEDLVPGSRIKLSDSKHSEFDFVLWKKTDKGIKWDSPWGIGRPGWHTECSCLINKYIGDSVTIHGGGMDLKFPHHENENAQNRALKNRSLANIWLHIGMINVNNEKMSKSLNNFILVKDILLNYSYQALRWFFYQTNYANPLNYSDSIMQQMEDEINKIKKSIYVAHSKLIFNNYKFKKNNKLIEDEFLNNLENNLNINNCVTIIYKLVKELNKLINQNDFKNAEIKLNILINSLSILGIEFENKHDSQIVSLIKEYKKFVEQKEYLKSDEIRKILIDKGLW